MLKINKKILTNISKCISCCVEKLLLADIIFRSDPLSLEFSPYSFGNVQMWRVYRKKEEIKSSVLPKRDTFLNAFGTMYGGVVKYKESLFAYIEGEVFQKVHDFRRIYLLLRGKLQTFTLPAYHSKTVQACGSFGKYTDFFTGKLPTVRNIPFCTNMGFIAIEQLDFMFCTKFFEFMQFLKLTFINSFAWFTPRPFPYTLISSAKLFKKRWNVRRLTLLPLDASQAALAACTFWRSALMAVRTDSLSVSIMSGLRPCPGLVYKPEMPSFWYRFTQWLTEASVISVMEPAAAELNPLDLRSTAIQRMRKQCVSPWRYSASKVWRASMLRSIFFMRPDMDTKIDYFKHISR